ncbi:PAAR-like protein [Flavobacterium johnsoniae]|uniref:PAAR-like protein n=1 Tax=Flavobacterium johnsoniae TaxID=986 RepID=UPI0021F83F57|nr:PAAR-like protein [Flavobacterium johnsoniae]
MNSSIPYLVKKEDTLESIAKELGITDPYDLRHYHNMNAEINDGIGQEPVQGKTLLTPSPEKIKEINAKRAKLDEAEEAEIQKEEQVKEEQHKEQKEEKEQEEKQEKETVQNAHNDKYFVVHGGLCSCDKAENPKQTAKLLVTSHNKVILNAEAGKFFATEIDKTFDPAAATFGKCTLKPSSAGNQPCALAPAPKWTKVYDKTSIFGNKVLTEISTLQCTVGGKIEVAKHGQTNTVMKEHAEKTNPAALALINPAVKMPNLKTAYPSVSSIALKSLKNDPDFKAVSSAQTKNVEKIVIRPNQECTFEAKVSKGNVDFVSWVIYEGFDGDKDKRLYTEEQIGTRFTYTFSTVGKYRIEGYGKPKQDDPEAETAYKSYPDCCLDIEVILNKLQGTELQPIDGGNFTKMIGGKMRLRQNFPASFKANFLMPPTDEELENLKMYVTDASGSVLKSTRIENTISFTPVNTKAKYTITAQYKLSAEEVQKQSFSAETITNSVSQITHNAEVIRPGTPMNFAVKESTFSLYIPDEQEAVAKEVQAVKWNLNGRLIGNGKSITIPGHELMNFGKYVIEAYVTLANAYGQNAKHEEDDWHFEVKENDVISFSYTGVPKVGKTTFLEADHLVFPDLTVNETVIWDTAIPHKTTDKKTISIKPLKAGKEIVKCRINRQQGKTLSIDVKQAKVLGMMFTDSNGIEIEKSGWHQTVNIWVQQEHLIGEDLTIEIWDNDAFKDDYCKAINIKSYDGNLIPFTLDSYVKSKAGDWAMLYVKISAPKLKLANTEGVFKSKNRLDVQDKREIYSAQIGSQDAKQRHYHVDYNQLSYFYGKSRGIKAGEKLKITIYEKGKKLFEVTDAAVDTSGAVKAKLQWDRISEKLPSRTVYAVVQDGEDKILYNGNKTANGGVAITKKSALLGLAEYKSAVLVKKSESVNSSGSCVCSENNLVWGNKINCDERKKVIEVSKVLGVDPNWLMTVIALETVETFSPSIDNGIGYVGLIQFGNSAASDLGTTKEKLIKMTFIEQMKYVQKHLIYVKNHFVAKKKYETLTDLYLAVLYPTASGHGKEPDYIVLSGKAYRNNPLFFKEKGEWEWATKVNKRGKEIRYKKPTNPDGNTYVWEIQMVAEEIYTKGLGFKKSISVCQDLKKGNLKSTKWHDPVENPRLTKYNYSGIVKPASGTYGWSRRNDDGSKKYHSGLDLFAIPKKDKVFACLKGNIHQVRYSSSAGWIIRIKIQNVKDLLEQEKNISYSTQFTDELKGIDIKETDDVFFIYMHLDSVVFTEEDATNRLEVEAGTVLGYAGVSGSIASGGHAPHLHLEVATVLDAYGKGESVRTNPARFINLQSYDTEDQDKEAKNKHIYIK